MKTAAQQKATNKYDIKAYDKLLIRLRKGTEPTREAITEAAAAAGLSVNAFIIEAVREKITGK